MTPDRIITPPPEIELELGLELESVLVEVDSAFAEMAKSQAA